MGIKPKGNVVRSNEPKLGYASLGQPQFEILAWCRDDKAELPPEQVHFVMHWPAQMKDLLPPMAIRFTSPDTLGFFIEELTRYRREVWPDSEKVEGEK